jgi:hypothetical protein
LDSGFSFLLVEKRPITMERYFDAARDTDFVACTQRLGVRYWRGGATARIITT